MTRSVTSSGRALPAFLVVAAVRGRAGVRDLASRSLRWRVGLRWYLLALLGVPIASVLAATALLGPATLDALAGKWPLLFTWSCRSSAEDQFLILNGVVIVGAILIIILTRGRLSYRPGRGRHQVGDGPVSTSV